MFGIFSGLLDLVTVPDLRYVAAREREDAARRASIDAEISRVRAELEEIDAKLKQARAELEAPSPQAKQCACGGELIVDRTMLLTCNPPRFNATCKKCGEKTTVLA